MSKLSTILTAAVAVAVLSSASFAAPSLTFSTKIINRYAVGADTASLETVTGANQTNYQGAGVGSSFDYKIEVDASFANPDAGNAFGSLAFDVNANGAAIPTTGTPITHSTQANNQYVSNNPLWTNDAGDTTSQVFQIAGDKGPVANDLLSLLAVVSQDATADSTGGGYGLDAADPRIAMMTSAGATGYKAPMKLGTFIVTWDGKNTSSISLANLQYAEINTTTTQFGQTFLNATASGVTFTASAVTTPEPASLGVLAIGGAALLARRKKA